METIKQAGSYPLDARRFQIRLEPGLAFILLLISMLAKESEMLQYAFCKHNAAKCNCGWGSAPDPGSLQHSPKPLADFKGIASRRKGDTGEWEGKGRRGRGEWIGREGTGPQIC